MITTVLLDIGGTVFIKNDLGKGIINPAIVYLNQHIPKTIRVVILSDTDMFDIPELLGKIFSELHYDNIYTKMMYSWIDKTQPETYTRVCKEIGTGPSECVLIDNLPEFRAAAEVAGVATYGVDQKSIEEFLESIK